MKKKKKKKKKNCYNFYCYISFLKLIDFFNILITFAVACCVVNDIEIFIKNLRLYINIYTLFYFTLF